MGIRSAFLGLLLALVPWFILHSAASESQTLWREDDQRVRVGLKLFPACLGALESLDSLLTPAGSLRVLVVYAENSTVARQAAASFESVSRIRDYPLEVQILSATKLDDYSGVRPAGIFVAGVELEPRRFRNWSEHHRTLVFSPFAGAVEGGAVAGIHVADRILPFIDPVRAQRAGLRFKSFFLDVARIHEGG